MEPFFRWYLFTITCYIHSSSVTIFVLYARTMIKLLVWNYFFIFNYPHSYRLFIFLILIILVYNSTIINIIIFFIFFYKLLILGINNRNYFFLNLFHFIINILLYIFYHFTFIIYNNTYFITIFNTNKFSNNIFSCLLLFNLLLS